MTDKWISISDAARVAHVSRRTIYNWLKEGKLEMKRLVSGSPRINEESLWKKNESPRT
jgi:excisionase family DNA binding protein